MQPIGDVARFGRHSAPAGVKVDQAEIPATRHNPVHLVVFFQCWTQAAMSTLRHVGCHEPYHATRVGVYGKFTHPFEVPRCLRNGDSISEIRIIDGKFQDEVIRPLAPNTAQEVPARPA